MGKFLGGSVSLILTDPPYFTACRELLPDKVQTLDEYMYWYEEWLKEASRVLTESGSIYVFIPPLEFAEIHLLIKKYFYQKQIISWVKPNVMIRQPTARNYLPKVEFIGFYVKNEKKYIWNRLAKKYGLQKSCNFDIEATIYRHTREGTDHSTQKPLRLVGKFVYASSNEGDVVLDPFCGSGTTCVAAKALSRRFIGVDIDSKYCRISNSRIGNVTCRDIFESKPKDALF